MAKRHYIPITADVPGAGESKCAFIRKVIRTALAAEGVKKVNGGTVGDDPRYEDTRWLPGWPT